MSHIVHVVGTGTIGEPLIGLLADHREDFGIDEVTFMKRTPLVDERPKVNDLIKRGAQLAVSADRWASFEELGHTPKFTDEEALARASVVIDCTPAGNSHKEKYEALDGPLGFIAQGSEFGFGKMYARGVNDAALVPGEDTFLQVVSCNTHNISSLVKTLAMDADGTSHLVDGRFVLLRRANDISQDGSFVPSPTVGRHDDEQFGTHHARDAHKLFETLGLDLPLYSSAVKLPTQYMHALWFSLTLDEDMTRDEAVDRLRANRRIALTHKSSANSVFSFGRDHGYYGRILNQAVVPIDSLAVRNGNELVGFCFTSQDGNSLLSSIASTLWYFDPNDYKHRIEAVKQYFFDEV
jgi:glyceraldehyde-3-phosphate dehydrogenase type II